MKPCVWGIITTYRRPELVRRALAALRDQNDALAGVIVVDNGGTGELEMEGLVLKIVAPPKNLGAAGGVAEGLRVFLRIADATHAWVMDDDTVTDPRTLEEMLAAEKVSGAEVVTSLLIDKRGQVAWYPGRLSQPAWGMVIRGVTPDELSARCGTAPLAWTWATWGSMLITRRAVEAVGMPDAKLWYQGTDIEYSLRLSARFKCVLAPGARCHHLVPEVSEEQAGIKELWSLQNGAYVAVRLPHGRRILRHLPGNHYRYWKGQGYRIGALGKSLFAFWNGAVLGKPAGLKQFLQEAIEYQD